MGLTEGDRRQSQGSDLRRVDSERNPERAFLSPRPVLESTVTGLRAVPPSSQG